MTRKPTCIACDKPCGPRDHQTHAAKNGNEAIHLCLACFERVARGGRKPKQTAEAVLFYQNDTDVGGPDDPLDHEDYRDLQLLGLWPPVDDDDLHGNPITEQQAEALKIGQAVRFYTGGKGGEDNPQRELSGTVTRVERVPTKNIGETTSVEVDLTEADGDVEKLYTWRGLLRYRSGAQEVRM